MCVHHLCCSPLQFLQLLHSISLLMGPLFNCICKNEGEKRLVKSSEPSSWKCSHQFQLSPAPRWRMLYFLLVFFQHRLSQLLTDPSPLSQGWAAATVGVLVPHPANPLFFFTHHMGRGLFLVEQSPAHPFHVFTTIWGNHNLTFVQTPGQNQAKSSRLAPSPPKITQ